MNSCGFTLIELIVTVTILAILASVIIPLSEMVVKREKELELRRSLRIIRSAIDEYKNAWDAGKVKKSPGQSGYPPDLITLVEGVEDVTSPDRKMIKFLRKIPKDPMTTEPYISAEESWGLRSYASDYDSPMEGDDVFDVYSRSEEIAIDGTPYNTW